MFSVSSIPMQFGATICVTRPVCSGDGLAEWALKRTVRIVQIYKRGATVQTEQRGQVHLAWSVHSPSMSFGYTPRVACGSTMLNKGQNVQRGTAIVVV